LFPKEPYVSVKKTDISAQDPFISTGKYGLVVARKSDTGEFGIPLKRAHIFQQQNSIFSPKISYVPTQNMTSLSQGNQTLANSATPKSPRISAKEPYILTKNPTYSRGKSGLVTFRE
jgi:hypothetical protein